METGKDNKAYFEGRAGGRVAVNLDAQEATPATPIAANETAQEDQAATENAAEVVLKTVEFPRGDGFRWRQTIEVTPEQSL